MNKNNQMSTSNMKKKLLMMGITGLSFLISTNGSAQSPVADFSINQQTTCVNSVVQLTDISTNTPTSWSYTVETMTGTLTVQNPTLSFSASGDYDVTLVATNASGSSAPVTKTITVNDLPVLSVSPATAVCAGDNATLSASGAATYTWSNGNANNASFVPSATADYTVQATDANNCVNSAVQTITVNPLPVLAFAGASFVCDGSTLTQTVSGADTYLWSTGVSGDNISEVPTASTSYSVTGTIMATGCSNTASKMITVDAYPTATVTDGAVCAGDVFTINATGAASYIYSTGSNTVIPTANDSYTVTGVSPNGCVSTVSAVVNVTVNALPVISVSGGTVCAGANFTLSPSGATTYTYSGGSAIVAPTTSQSYSVTGRDANGCAAAAPAVANLTVSAAPVLTVSSGAICAGDSYTITASGANTFTFSAGTDVVSPATTTVYTVLGTDPLGCVSAATNASVTVNALPVLTIANGAICAGDSYTISPNGASTYTYSSGSNVVTPASNQTYSVTGTDANGCITASAAVVSVSVNALPTLTVTDGVICAGGSFTISPVGASTYTYSSGSNVVTPTANQTYSVTGTDANGCVTPAAAVVNVTVNALPVVTANSGAICAGGSFTISPSGASTYTYSSISNVITPASSQTVSVSGTDANGCVSAPAVVSITVHALPVISVNGGAVCMGSSFTVIATGASTYTYSSGSNVVTPTASQTVSVTGTDANGCVSAAAMANITVNALPVVSVNSGAICSGASFTITPSGASTYTYSSGSNVVTPTANQAVSVTGTDANGCVSAAAVSNITVNALPAVAISIPSATICTGESAILTASGAVSYVWGTTETTSTISITPATTTDYTVTGTDANGCAKTVSGTQVVSDCTGITKIAANSVDAGVYPNPNNGVFAVKVSQSTSITIINVVGKVVYSSELNEGENSISLNEQPTGIYFVQLKQGNQSKTVRVVKN